MWVFTRYGFVSVVCAKENNGGVVLDTVVVRARVKRQLEMIRKTCGLTAKIVENAGTDYAFRMVVAKNVWAVCMRDLTEDIDYTNFKGEVELNEKPVGRLYADALHRIWSIMWGLQSRGK